MSIETFSGCHAWHPTVLNDTDAVEEGNADEIIDNIESGFCPRCEGPLPELPEFPAGSRITKCRSIPICGPCGSDEVFEQSDRARGIGWGLSSAAAWPRPIEEIAERKLRYEREMTPATLTISKDRALLLTDEGVGEVIIPCNTGGWLQYGFSDEHDDGPVT